MSDELGALKAEIVVWEGRSLTVEWLEPPFLPPLSQITQASGVCVTGDRRIVLVSEDGADWGLPGGHPEPGETAEQVLRREVREEACAEVLQSKYLGCQRVSDPELKEAYYQTRFWARVELGGFKPQFETRHRRLIGFDRFLVTLSWGRSPIAELLLSRVRNIQNSL